MVSVDDATERLLHTVIAYEGSHPIIRELSPAMPMEDLIYIDMDDLVSEPFSTSFLRLSRDGWVYDGLHHAGGGMGCHVCDEFVHPKWGRLSFSAAISHMADGEPEWKQFEQAHPFRDYSSWFLMLDDVETDWDDKRRGMTRVDSGESLDELDMVLSNPLLEAEQLELGISQDAR